VAHKGEGKPAPTAATKLAFARRGSFDLASATTRGIPELGVAASAPPAPAPAEAGSAAPAAPAKKKSGCGCAAAGPSASWLVGLMLVGLALLLRRAVRR
jgi:MYXO-CTERM domain-containing protein